MNVHRQKLAPIQLSNIMWMDVQMLVYPYNRMLSNKNELTIDRCNNIDEFQWLCWGGGPGGKPGGKEVHSVYSHLYKFHLQNANYLYSDRKHINGCPVMEGLEDIERKVLQRDMKKLLRVMDMFIILTVVMVSRVYIKLIKLYILNMCSLLYVNHI